DMPELLRLILGVNLPDGVAVPLHSLRVQHALFIPGLPCALEEDEQGLMGVVWDSGPSVCPWKRQALYALIPDNLTAVSEAHLDGRKGIPGDVWDIALVTSGDVCGVPDEHASSWERIVGEFHGLVPDLNQLIPFRLPHIRAGVRRRGKDKAGRSG